MTAPAFRLAGIIGMPVAQSRSALMYQYWRDLHGLPGAYVPMPVLPERLADALRGLVALGFAGCNVTMPHKAAVLALVDRADALSRAVGAVNLVIVEPDGSLSGFNTDGEGFMASLRQSHPGWQAVGGPVLVLGAGGGAAAVVTSLAGAGVPEIRLCNRTFGHAAAMAERAGGDVRAVPWEDRHRAAEGVSLLVNTTKLGMAGQAALDMRLESLPPAAIVADIVYNPLETPLLAAARARGHGTADGLSMLLHQGVPCFERYWGTRPAVTPALYRVIAATL